MAFTWDNDPSSPYYGRYLSEQAAANTAASANISAVAARDAPLRGDRQRRRRRRPSTILGDAMAQTSIALQTLLGA